MHNVTQLKKLIVITFVQLTDGAVSMWVKGGTTQREDVEVLTVVLTFFLES